MKRTKNKKKFSGFTLVELVISISIIAILSSISIVVYNNHSINARDSVRENNISNIMKGLEEYATIKGVYPLPDNYKTVTYSGVELWYQGTLGEVLSKELKFTEKPYDVKYDTEYSYSVTSQFKQYEIGTIKETKEDLSYNNIISNTYAASKINGIAYLKGNYNKLFVYGTDLITGKNIFVSSPSITLGDLTQTEITNSNFNSGSYVIDKKSNIPETYKNSNFILTGSLYYEPTKLIETNSNLTQTDFNSLKISLLNSYNGTILTTYSDLGESNIWRKLYQTGSQDLSSIVNSSLNLLTKGNFSFEKDVLDSCNGTTYSGSLYNNYIINSLSDGENRNFNRTTNIMSGANIIGTNNFSLILSCNNGTFNHISENKSIICNSGYVSDGNNCISNL